MMCEILERLKKLSVPVLDWIRNGISSCPINCHGEKRIFIFMKVNAICRFLKIIVTMVTSFTFLKGIDLVRIPRKTVKFAV